MLFFVLANPLDITSYSPTFVVVAHDAQLLINKLSVTALQPFIHLFSSLNEFFFFVIFSFVFFFFFLFVVLISFHFPFTTTTNTTLNRKGGKEAYVHIHEKLHFAKENFKRTAPTWLKFNQFFTKSESVCVYASTLAVVTAAAA